MKIVDFIKKMLGIDVKTPSIMRSEGEKTQEKDILEKSETLIISLWDYLNFNEHTQAFHLKSILNFNEWLTMDEIRRRIMDLFQIDYQNERSLYPYLKTLVDTGLIETNNIGDKRKWRKKELLIKIEKKKKETEEINIKQAVSSN
jgi:hypothetical protein